MKANGEIFVSTVAFKRHTIHEMIQTCVDKKWKLEFSSGLPFIETMEDIFVQAPVHRLPHNYFPAPRDPFVLNLASLNDSIRERSIQMCLNGLRLTKQSGGLFYAAHAGFCIDPSPDQLGRQLEIDIQFDKAQHWTIFTSSVKRVLEYAHFLDSLFLIENNVIASFNLTKEKQNPLFCCNALEMIQLINEIADPNLGILLDTAHLKVSANTLGNDPLTEMEQLLSVIKALHHSDNNGLTDSNDRLTNEYWCKELLPALGGKPHVIEVKDLSQEEIEDQIGLLSSFILPK
jgi:hypothetical protein